MNRRAVLVGAAALAPLAARAAGTSTLGDRLIGTWQIVDAETVDARTGQSSPWGGRPRPYSGVIVYQPDGWMSVHIGAARPASLNDTRPKALSDAEKVALLDSWYGYYGRYEIDEVGSKIHHHVVGSLFASESGRTLTRSFSLTGDQLTLQTLYAQTADNPSFNRLVWQRAR